MRLQLPKNADPENPHKYLCFWACRSYTVAAEQKARTTYDNILRFCDDYDVKDAIRFLREREVVHYQRFGENLRLLTDKLDEKNYYAFNPSFDKKCFKNQMKKK